MRSMQWQLGILGTISAFAYRHRETKKPTAVKWSADSCVRDVLIIVSTSAAGIDYRDICINSQFGYPAVVLSGAHHHLVLFGSTHAALPCVKTRCERRDRPVFCRFCVTQR